MDQISGKGVQQLQPRMENYSKEWLESQNLQNRHYLLAVKAVELDQNVNISVHYLLLNSDSTTTYQTCVTQMTHSSQTPAYIIIEALHLRPVKTLTSALEKK